MNVENVRNNGQIEKWCACVYMCCHRSHDVVIIVFCAFSAFKLLFVLFFKLKVFILEWSLVEIYYCEDYMCLFFLDSLHRVLAEDVFAAEPLPPFRASIKDGYAVVGRVT